MRRWHLIPIGFVALVVIGLPVLVLTNSGIKHDLKVDLGFSTGECEPTANPASGWETRQSLPYELDEPRAATLDGEIYLAGGQLNVSEESDGRLYIESSDEFTRFDPKSETFTELKPLPRPLNHVGVVAYRHHIYVLGGYEERRDENTGREFFRYDPKTNSWSQMPPMPRARAAAAMGMVGAELIVAAGARNSEPVSETVAYDFQSGRWRTLPPMPTRREHVGTAVVGDRLYVLGGRSPDSLAVDTAESYDVSERRWHTLPRMPVPTGGLGAVSIEGDVIAVGGGNDDNATVTGAVQEFDPLTERWKLLSPLRIARHGQATAAVGDTIWVFGGAPCAYTNETDSVETLEVKGGQ